MASIAPHLDPGSHRLPAHIDDENSSAEEVRNAEVAQAKEAAAERKVVWNAEEPSMVPTDENEDPSSRIAGQNGPDPVGHRGGDGQIVLFDPQKTGLPTDSLATASLPPTQLIAPRGGQAFPSHSSGGPSTAEEEDRRLHEVAMARSSGKRLPLRDLSGASAAGFGSLPPTQISPATMNKRGSTPLLGSFLDAEAIMRKAPSLRPPPSASGSASKLRKPTSAVQVDTIVEEAEDDDEGTVDESVWYAREAQRQKDEEAMVVDDLEETQVEAKEMPPNEGDSQILCTS